MLLLGFRFGTEASNLTSLLGVSLQATAVLLDEVRSPAGLVKLILWFFWENHLVVEASCIFMSCFFLSTRCSMRTSKAEPSHIPCQTDLFPCLSNPRARVPRALRSSTSRPGSCCVPCPWGCSVGLRGSAREGTGFVRPMTPELSMVKPL